MLHNKPTHEDDSVMPQLSNCFVEFHVGHFYKLILLLQSYM